MASASRQIGRESIRQALAEDEDIAWEKYLVKDTSEPTFRFPVAHQHQATGCFGLLYISRSEIRYADAPLTTVRATLEGIQ